MTRRSGHSGQTGRIHGETLRLLITPLRFLRPQANVTVLSFSTRPSSNFKYNCLWFLKTLIKSLCLHSASSRERTHSRPLSWTNHIAHLKKHECVAQLRTSLVFFNMTLPSNQQMEAWRICVEEAKKNYSKILNMAINTSRSKFLLKMDKLWAEWETDHMHLGDRGCLGHVRPQARQSKNGKNAKNKKACCALTYTQTICSQCFRQPDLSVHLWVPVEKLR